MNAMWVINPVLGMLEDERLKRQAEDSDQVKREKADWERNAAVRRLVDRGCVSCNTTIQPDLIGGLPEAQ